MYVQGGVAPGGVTWPDRAWVSRREVSDWPLNDALKHEIHLPSSTQEALEASEVRPWKCGGGEEGGEGGGGSKIH